MKITFIEKSTGGIFSLDKVIFTQFLRRKQKNIALVSGDVFFHYGDIISAVLNGSFEDLLKCYWNNLRLFVKTDFIKEEPFPWSFELFQSFFSLLYGSRTNANEYIDFINNVLYDDGTSLKNVQKAALFEMVYERGGNVLSYVTEYQSLFDVDSNPFDAESAGVISKICIENPHSEEGMKAAISLFQGKNIPVDTYGMYLFADFKNFFNYVLGRAVTLDIKIKKCANCGRYFYPENRSDTIYCGHKSPQDGNLSCKEYGSQKLWYENLKNNESMKLCRNIYQSKQMLVKRNPDIDAYKKSFERFKEESKVWKSDVRAGVKTEDEFLIWLRNVKANKFY